MADKLVAAQTNEGVVTRRLRDMGDGTFAEVVALAGSGTSGATAAGENHIGEVGGSITRTAAEFARPADTTAYAAKDAVADSTSVPTVLTFAGAARAAGRGGYIVGARFMTDQAANVARYRLHLFHTAPAAINDNSPYTLLWANRANRIGFLDFAATQTEGAGSTAANALNATDRIPFDLPAEGTSVFGLLETLDAFTPASAQNFHVELVIDQT